MSDEIKLTKHKSVRVKWRGAILEWPIIQLGQRGSDAGDGALSPSTPASPASEPQRESAPSIGTLSPNRSKPARRARPKEDPGVLALVSYFGDGKFWPVAMPHAPDLGNLSYLKILVDLDELELPRDALRLRIRKYRNRAAIPPVGPFILDVKVNVSPGEKLALPDLESILRDPTFGVAAIRLIRVPDED